MEHNYRFDFNPEVPKSSDIEQHMDFDALLAKYEAEGTATPPLQPAKPKAPAVVRSLGRRPLYRNWAVAASLLLAMGLGLWMLWPQNNSALSEAEYFAQQPFVNPPTTQIKPQFTSYKINNQSGGSFDTPSGSRLVVPTIAFANEYGNAVEGEVELFYREMHDPVDFFLSGIPMYYDSLGVRYTLVSGGMIEVFAQQNGKRLQLAPGKNIDIQLISQVQENPTLDVPPGYNIYQLDTLQRQWVYRQPDQIEYLDAMSLPEGHAATPALNQLKAELQAIKTTQEQKLAALDAHIPMPVKPLIPQMVNPETPTFELDFLNAEQKANTYTGTIWQLSPNASGADLSILQQQWLDADLHPVNERDYELRLTNGSQQATLLVSPVLLDTDYATAKARYDADMVAYEQAIEVRQSALADQVANIKDQSRKDLANARNDYNQAITALGLDINQVHQLTRRKVKSTFTIDGLGIWNVDRPVAPLPKAIKATFEDQEGNRLTNHPCFLIDRSRNTIERFYVGKEADIRFDGNSETVLWLVTGKNEIAIVRPDAFAEIEGDTHTFVTERMEVVLEDEAVLRKIL